MITDAGGAFESGDSFLVYPNGDGVLESLRHEVFFDGLQDRQALYLLENMKGRAFVLNLLTEAGISGFTEYKKADGFLSGFRLNVNSIIKAEMCGNEYR